MTRFNASLCIALALHSASLFAQSGTPLPSGFSVVSPAPNTSGRDEYGQNPRVVLDANGDPMVSFFWSMGPNGTNSNTTLYFSAWSRAQAKFSTPLKIAVTGDVAKPSLSPTLPLSMARDSSNNTIGIAFQAIAANGANSLHLAVSVDNGATFKDQVVLASPQSALLAPALAMAGGKVFLTFYQENTGLLYYTGNAADAPSKWTSLTAPVPSGYSLGIPVSSLALDSAGVPAVVYLAVPDRAYNYLMLFWRPGAKAANAISDTNNLDNSGADIKLAFYGTEARVVFQGALNNDDYFNNYISLFTTYSKDGVTWAQLSKVPPDNHNSFDPPVSVAVGSKGQSLISAQSNGGQGDNACGQPKLARSADFIKWTTCAPAPAGMPSFGAQSPQVVVGPDDRATLVFQVPAGNDLTYGVVIWREAAGDIGIPSIATNGLVNAASFLAPVSPGALATAFGNNLATSAAAATAVPLPTTLGGVRVLVNGIAAPLIFINPTQANFQVPYETALGTANVVISNAQGSSAAAPLTVNQVAPAIFVFNSNRAVAQNPDYSVNELGNGAMPGTGLVIYMTGSGPVTNPVKTGIAAPNSPLSYETISPITAKVGTANAQVVFAGLAPQFIGLMQVNIAVPALSPGTYPLTITLGTVTSNSANITIR